MRRVSRCLVGIIIFVAYFTFCKIPLKQSVICPDRFLVAILSALNLMLQLFGLSTILQQIRKICNVAFCKYCFWATSKPIVVAPDRYTYASIYSSVPVMKFLRTVSRSVSDKRISRFLFRFMPIVKA